MRVYFVYQSVPYVVPRFRDASKRLHIEGDAVIVHQRYRSRISPSELGLWEMEIGRHLRQEKRKGVNVRLAVVDQPYLLVMGERGTMYGQVAPLVLFAGVYRAYAEILQSIQQPMPLHVWFTV